MPDARIVIDQRVSIDSGGKGYLDGVAYLGQGNAVSYGSTDTTNVTSATQIAAVNSVAQEFGSSYTRNATGSNNPIVGLSMDATYQIKNKDGTLASGTFVYAICGINLDRDPDAVGGNNVGKTLWYSYQDSFEEGAGKEFSFFSEAMSINDGMVSDNVYVRPNIPIPDNPSKPDGSGDSSEAGQYFYPNVSRDGDKIKFIANAHTPNSSPKPNVQGSNASYSSGFVTLADATGFKVTVTGHGGNTAKMDTPAFNSKQIWHRYTSSTGSHGKIQTTSEGNYQGTLDDGGDIYQPDGTWNHDSSWSGSGTPGTGQAATHVVAEGKDVYYTLTPDIGYKLSSLWLGKTWNENQNVTEYDEITFNGEAVSSMKKGDSMPVTTVAGHDGTLTYNEDGTYVLKLPYAEHNEAVHVEWEPVTADILVYKRWQDENDKDGLRADAESNNKLPKLRLEYSTTGGTSGGSAIWKEVKSDDPIFGYTMAKYAATVEEETVPAGKDGSEYKDGSYVINNDTTGNHPFTWEYLPVYTYDSNGTADSAIIYRIVEIPDPGIEDYEKAQYYDEQFFDLRAPKTKTKDGWVIYEDIVTHKQYVKKGDGLYYDVVDDKSTDTAAEPQPAESDLTTITSSEYWTVDKGTAYQSLEVKNRHVPTQIYIEFTKRWNDGNVFGKEPTDPPNEYDRQNLKFILHGENEYGPVDINKDDPQKLDIEIIITKDESDDKADVTGNKTIDGYTVYKDTNDTEYALVEGSAQYQDGYYPLSSPDSIDYDNGPVSVTSDLTVVKKGDGTYRIDADNFGALIEDLPTHDAGKPITYTLKEKLDDGYDSDLDGWVISGGKLEPVTDSSGKITGYTTDFVNTPDVDEKRIPLPLNIVKKDSITNTNLEEATFTVYKNPVTREKATENTTETIDGNTVYTDGNQKYVKQNDNKYYTFTEGEQTRTIDGYTVYKDSGNYRYALVQNNPDYADGYYTVTAGAINYGGGALSVAPSDLTEDKEGSGTYNYTIADPQPAETSISESKEAGTGEVDKNVVTTKGAAGKAVINFNKAGTYYLVETDAPTGYTEDATVYTFVVGEDLQSITLKSADAIHDSKWYELFYNLLYKTGTTSESNWDWSSSDRENGTLTVKDDPIRANVLITKVWDDDNDRDGLRAGASAGNTLPKVVLEKTTDDPSSPTATWSRVPSDVTVENRTVYSDGSTEYVRMSDGYYTFAPDGSGGYTYTWADPQPDSRQLTEVMSVQPKTIPDTDGSITVDLDNYYTWANLPAYEDGKLLYYRAVEYDGQLADSSPFLPGGDYPEETAYDYTAKTAVGDEENFNIITNPSNPTPRNRTVVVTNKHIPRKIDIVLSKDWADDNGDTSQREAAGITLYKTVNGIETVYEALPGAVPIEPAEPDHVFKIWNDLPVYENGFPVTYRVEETPLEFYATTYNRTYTDTSDTAHTREAGDSLNVSTVKRTFTGSSAGGDRDETTTADFNIRNANLQKVEVSKTWVYGANANVTYEIYRTVSTDDNVTDWELAKSLKDVTINGRTYQNVGYWTPSADANWEKVLDANGDPVTISFGAGEFNKSDVGHEVKKYIDLPKADGNGNIYTYRVYEVGSETSTRYVADQKSNTGITNTNPYASNGYANVNVVKELMGRDWTNSDRFYFRIEPNGIVEGGSTIYGKITGESGIRNIENASDVPVPQNNGVNAPIKDVDKEDPQVGAVGHNVGFDPIEFTEAIVARGETGEFYYRVYEVADQNGNLLDDATNHTGVKDGITYEGKVEEGSGGVNQFKPTVHTLKIVVVDDTNGTLTTALYWDGSDTQSAVPVITNKYDAATNVTAHFIKQVHGREITGTDEFKFIVTNIGGSPIRDARDGNKETSSISRDTESHITPTSGRKVTPSGSNYNPAEGNNGYYRAVQTGNSTWIKVSDLTQKTVDGKATDTFIYEFYEDASSVSDGSNLTLDGRRIYLKVVATDNENGTLDIRKSYHTDAACTEANRINTQVLVAKSDGSIAPAGATAGEDYEYVPAALFTNSQIVSIPVKKEWVGGPAVEDVVLNLKRKLIPLADENNLTYSGVENIGSAWRDVGYTTIVNRGDFINPDGTPKYDEGSTDTSSKDINGVEGFNLNLPKYVTENGVTYRAVYKLEEDDSSDAYTTEYRSVKGGDTTDGNNVFLDGETLIVKNTVVATNTASIASVKQLLGRQWLASDKFTFTIEPYGVSEYNEDGTFKRADTSDAAKARVPMPDGSAVYVNENDPTDIITAEEYDALPDTQKQNYKLYRYEANAVSTSQVVDQNGGLERLAAFTPISYDMNDLTYDAVEGHMQGGFFYIVREVIPDSAVMLDDNGAETTTTYAAAIAAGTDLTGKKFRLPGNDFDGITYDATPHKVHVKIRENRTQELVVQVAYDERAEGDITTGTQFTPVYTNNYDAKAEHGASIEKYIMGREFVKDETFTFRATPLGNAPMVPVSGGASIDDFTSTLTIAEAADMSAPQKLTLPDMLFELDELGWTVGANSAADPRDSVGGTIKLSDGTNAIPGMKYDRFMYQMEETATSATDLNVDPNPEYVRVTVIDKGDGTLDAYTEIFADREATIPRIKPGTADTPADASVFVNQLKRNLTVEKVWTDTATSDVTFKLQWSSNNGENWYDADGTAWLAGIEKYKTITKEEYNNGTKKTVVFENLPAYANINSAQDQTGDNNGLNDLWIVYHVVEADVPNTTARYDTTAIPENAKASDYADDKYSANNVHTEKSTDTERKDKIWVGNFPNELFGRAAPHVVKQLIGRSWNNADNFVFEILPIESKLPGDTDYVPYETRSFPMPEDATYDPDTQSWSGNGAPANMRSTPVSVGEYNATFRDIIIKSTDLKVDTGDGIGKGEFKYAVRERIPDGARPIDTDGDGNTDYYVVNNTKYTAASHTVTVMAENKGDGVVTTQISYDGRAVGDFVPVYTNEALLPTPIQGTKTWIGGDESEHKVIDETGEDILGIQIKRKTPTTQDWGGALDKDDAGNALSVRWSDEDGDGKLETFTIMAVNPDTTSTEKYIDPVLDEADAFGNEYEYEVLELTHSGYDVTYATDSSRNIINNLITNISNKTDSLKVTKTWEDAQNAEGIRPEKVIVHLYKDVEVTLTEDEINAAKATVPTVNIDDYDEDHDGQVDDDKQEAYEAAVAAYETAVQEAIDAALAEKTRSENPVQVEVKSQEIRKQTGDTDDVWSTGITWEGLPVWANGKKIKYYVVEESEYGYSTKYKVTSDPSVTDYTETGNSLELDGTDGAQSVDVMNSLSPSTDKVEVTKIWDDNNNNDNKRPGSVTFTLKKYVWDTTANAYSTTAQLVSGTSGTGRPAVKADVDAAKEIDPESKLKVGDIIKIEDLVFDGTPDDPTDTQANETESWKGSWINLPLTENGKTIIYVVDEVVTGSEYAAAGTPGKYSNTPVITGDQIKGFNVENVYTPMLKSASITKVWADDNNSLGVRPDTLTFELWRSTDAPTSEKVTADADGNPIKTVISADDKSSSDANKWEYTIGNLPAYGYVTVGQTEVSKEYTYFWKEVVPTGYTASGRYNGSDITPVVGDGTKTAELDVGSTVTNTYAKGSIVVTKTWDDNNNEDGTRPTDKIFAEGITLRAGDREVTVDGTVINMTYAAGSTANTTVVTYTGLPVYDKNGTKISYSIEEALPNGYEITTAPQAATMSETDSVWSGNITLTNRHVPGTVSLNIKKVWVDKDADSTVIAARPTSIDVLLKATVSDGATAEFPTGLTWTKNGNDYTATKTITGAASATNWNDAIAGLPELDSNSQPITYTVSENRLPNYVDPEISNSGNVWTIINTYERTELTGKKVWKDGGLTHDNTKEINLTLKRQVNGGEVQNVDNPHIHWTGDDFVITGLPAKDLSGNEYTYWVSEAQVSGYDAPQYSVNTHTTGTVTDGITSGGTITNVLLPEYVTVSGTKTWVGTPEGTTHDNEREITFTLKRISAKEGSTEETLTTDDSGKQLKVVWNNNDYVYKAQGDTETVDATLNKRDADGYEYTYSVTEAPIEGYTTTQDGYNFTNTFDAAHQTLRVVKVWDDANNAEGLRPDSIRFHLYRDDATTGISAGVQMQTISDTTADDQSVRWIDVPIYDGDGNEIKYFAVEEAVAGYTSTVTGFTDTQVQKTDANGNPIYKDGAGNETTEAEGNEPVMITVKQATVTNKLTPATTEVKVTKVWDDDDDVAKMRPDTGVVIRLKERVWDETAGKYGDVKDATYANGQRVPDITLDGKPDEKETTAWTATFTNLSETKNGKTVIYSVEEITDLTDTEGYNPPVITGNQFDGYTVTNRRDYEVITKVSLTVFKQWDDNNNQDGVRPESVTVQLRRDGVEVEGKTLELNEGNNWTVVFEGLEKSDPDDRDYSYTVTETSTDGYSTRYEYKKGNNWQTDIPDDWRGRNGEIRITNKHVTDTVKVQASKKWTGEPEGDTSIRPNKVDLHLYGLDENGKIVYDAGEQEIGSPFDSTASWTVPKYHYSDKAMTWKLVEEAVIGYIPLYSSDVDREGNVTFVVTNAYAESTSTIRVNKIWNDDNNNDGHRPDTVYYQLWQKIWDPKANTWKTEKYGDPVAGGEDDGYTWTDLPTNSTYTEKREVEKTTVEYIEVPVTKEITPAGATKPVTMYEFTDSADEDDVRIIYSESKDGGEPWYDAKGNTVADVDPKTVKPNTTQEIKEGTTEVEIDVEKPIYYTVTEIYDGKPYEAGKSPEDRGYSEPVVTVATDASGKGIPGEYEAVNSREPDTVKVTVKKVWANNDDVDAGVRPDHVTVSVMDGDTVAGKTTLSADGGWTYTFEGLKKNRDGKPIEYKMLEDVPEGYSVGYTMAGGEQIVTNTYNKAPSKTLRVTKVWEDGDDPSDRKDVVLHLVRVNTEDGSRKDMGQEYQKTIAADATGDDLTVTWTNLPSVVDGRVVTYTVEEDAIARYTTNISDGAESDNTISITVTNVRENKISVTYKEPGEFEDKILQGPDYIFRGDAEPEAPKDPSHAGYTFTGWTRSVDGNGNVTYTARYGEIPVPEKYPVKVSYVDPHGEDGKMILRATRYDDQAQADAAAKSYEGAPEDPSHDGYIFTGWVLNQDEFGDWVLMAKYNEVPPEPARKLISYIDPQTGEIIMSGYDGDPITPPAGPAHDDMSFVGWMEVIDANGNKIYVAKYASDCSNRPTPAPTPTDPTDPTNPTDSKGNAETAPGENSGDPDEASGANGSGRAGGVSAADTGDEANITIWIMLIAASLTAVGAVTLHRRRKGNGE